jgi:hypothetical protein
MGTILFLLVVLVVVLSTVVLLYQRVRRQFSKARWTLLFLGVVIGVYGGALLVTSLTSTSRILPLNQNKCFDEWCAAVVNVSKTDVAGRSRDYMVTLKVSNTGKGRAQRPDNPHVFVVDANQNTFEASPAAQAVYESQNGQQPAVNQLIQAGTSFTTTMVFRLPADAKGYVVITEGGWPTYFTIGDEGSWLHKESLTPLN